MIHQDANNADRPGDLESALSAFWQETKAAYQAAASGHLDEFEAALARRQRLLERAGPAARRASAAELAAASEFAPRIQTLAAEIETDLRSRLQSVRDGLAQVRRGKRLADAHLRSRRRRGGAIFQRDA